MGVEIMSAVTRPLSNIFENCLKQGVSLDIGKRLI